MVEDNLKRVFEGVEVVNGLKIEYVDDETGIDLIPVTIYMNFKVNEKEDFVVKNIKGYGVYRIETTEPGIISGKYMVLSIRYRKMVRVVLNLERSDGIVISSEVLDKFRGSTLTRKLSAIEYYIPAEDKIEIKFDRNKVITVKYLNINDEIATIDKNLKQINKDIKTYSRDFIWTIEEGGVKT